MANKAKHAFGALERIDESIANDVLDSYDILFVKDANGKPYVGWIDKDGNKVIVQEDEKIVRVNELPKTDGDENVVYIYNNEGYIWDSVSGQCISMSKSADLSALEEEIATKVDEATVDSKIETAINKAVSVEIVEF